MDCSNNKIIKINKLPKNIKEIIALNNDISFDDLSYRIISNEHIAEIVLNEFSYCIIKLNPYPKLKLKPKPSQNNNIVLKMINFIRDLFN